MYALAQYVPRGNQETIAAKEVDDTRLGRRVTSPPHTHLHAISSSVTKRSVKKGAGKAVLLIC